GILPTELGLCVVRAGKDEESRERGRRRVGDVRGRPTVLLQAVAERRLDGLELRDARRGAHQLNPAAVEARLDAVDLVERVVAVLLRPERAARGVEVHPEAVAYAVGEDLLDVGGRLSRLEGLYVRVRVVGGRRAVVVESEDDAGQVRVVGLGAAELVV